ncbi:MAG: FAD-dependent oxidoreductase [Gaiellaceae bacterium]
MTGGEPIRVLIAGGGVAALEATLALRALAGKLVAVELLAPEPHFWYRPLAVVEPFGGGHVQGVELVELARACDAQLTLGALAAVDADRHVARTASGAEIEYDALLVATGARPVTAVTGALTFRGLADSDLLLALLEELEEGGARRLTFAVPGGVSWPLPLYELALQTAVRLRARPDVELALVTPEVTPLGVFGDWASQAVAALLRERGIRVYTARHPVSFEDGWLALAPTGAFAADRVVALPRLEGVSIPGLPHDADGFIPVDSSGRVRGRDDVYAAGDATAFPVKQGGLAAQQAVAAAETIAGVAGAAIRPQPFRPVLRGLLLTGGRPFYLRAEVGERADETSTATAEPLWWPPGKVAGRHLAPFLAERAGIVLAPRAEASAAPSPSLSSPREEDVVKRS